MSDLIDFSLVGALAESKRVLIRILSWENDIGMSVPMLSRYRVPTQIGKHGTIMEKYRNPDK